MKFSDRAGYLERVRNRKMAESPHAFVRGSTSLFYEWLQKHDQGLPQGPAIWICGDCHLGNLGALADLEGGVAIQIRDFDQTVIGNPAHDLVRLGLSLASAIRSSDLPGVTTAHMLDNLLAGYIEARAVPSGAAGRSDDLKKLIKRAVRRRWHNLATERFEGSDGALPRNRRFWPLHRGERGKVLSFCHNLNMLALTPDTAHHGKATWKVVDAAYWIKGCSSLGHLRVAALLRGKHHRMALLDVKEATAAAAPAAPHTSMPKNHAERVIAGAKAISPNLGDRMACGLLDGKPVFVRAISPQDMKLEIDSLTGEQTQTIAHHLGAIVGLSHRQQMEDAAWQSWTKDLRRTADAKADAPTWLWASVVDLLASHELAYLDHCRRFALAK
ncbi:DUF2252 domain-containing protein [Mesorhizobium sp. B2-1-3A]|nr:DUF2252 family protein [Mesorhizobium sp. B2-1-3A]TPM95045.1 DUF2252 domain-containing protein [Mesorhizobium sp. B2-1-3A]